MCKSVIKGAIIGGIIAFVWGFVSWVILPWHCTQFKHFKNEAFVSAAIKENMTKDGVYMIPSFPRDLEKSEAMKRQEHLMKRGPFVFGSFVQKGVEPMNYKNIIGSLITQIVAAGFLSYLIAASRMKCYWNKLWACVVAAIFAGIISYIPIMNWFHFPIGYIVVGMLDFIIAWLLAGFAIAGLVKTNTCCPSGQDGE